MLKKIKRYFNKTYINNERGSVMSIALIVITILTFSITTITQVTVNLAGATTLEIQQVNSENEAKSLINISINEFKYYINDPDELGTFGDFTTFNNVEIGRISDEYGVVVTDVTIDLGYGTSGNVDSVAYKFAHTLSNGATLYKYSIVSNYGTELLNFEPFDYSIGTNGTLILNGGRYTEMLMYGNKIWLTGEAPYIQSGTTNQLVTPQSSEEFPVLTNGTASEIWASTEYRYCEDNCFTTNALNNPFIIRESNYIDVDGSTLPDQGNASSSVIADFFGSFDYNDFFINYIRYEAPRLSEEIPIEFTFDDAKTTILAYSNDLSWTSQGGGKFVWPDDSHFVNITVEYDAHQSEFDFSKAFKVQGKQKSLVYENNLTITDGFSMTTDESLIVFQDLTLEGTGRIQGMIVVFGDLYINGDDTDFEGSILVLGQTFINKNDLNGISTTGNNMGFTIIAKDNIIVQSLEESHTPTANPSLLSVFFYTEESIYIDAVNSELILSGSLFARASGASGNEIFMIDDSLVPIRGIVINSYMGYVDGSGVAYPLTDEYRYDMSTIPGNNYVNQFLNIPVFDTLVTSPGDYTFEETEFILE